MEHECQYTAPSDDTVAFESSIAESQILNTEAVDVSESAQHSGDDQMEDYCKEEVVLDSDDEGGDIQNEVVDVCESAQHLGDDQVKDYCEQEVVLDSDDEVGDRQKEGDNLVKGSRPVTGRFSGRDAIDLLKRQKRSAGSSFRRLDNKVIERVFLYLDSPRSDRCDEDSNDAGTCLYNDSRCQDHRVVSDSSPDQKPIITNMKESHMNIESSMEYSPDERKLLSHEPKSINMGNDSKFDPERAELNYVGSPEAAESHDKALDFVERYLSVSGLGSCKDVETRKINRIKSPPSLISKGSQSLARRVNLGCTARRSTTFDWDKRQIEKGDYDSERMKKVGFKGNKSGFVSVNQDSDNLNSQNEISCLQSKDELPGNTLSTYDVCTNSLESNDIDKRGSNCRIWAAYDSIELNEPSDAGLSWQNVEKGEELRLTPDELDIGLDTQIAAEAMEALTHAAPPIFNACFPHQGSDITLLDSSINVDEKDKSKHVANHEEVFVGWRRKEKRSKCVNISTVQNTKESCSAEKHLKNRKGTVSQMPFSKNLMSKNLMAGNVLNGRQPGNTRNRGPPGIPVQQEECGFTEGGLNGFQNLHPLYDRKPSETIYEMNSDSPPKRRKVISFNGDGRKTGATEKNYNPDVTDRTLSKSNMRIYPKRKRARQCAWRHSITSSNQCSPHAAIENNVEKYPVVNEEAHKWVAMLLVYKRRHKFSLEREHIRSSLKLDGDLSSSGNDNAVFGEQVQIPTDFDTTKLSTQSSKFDNGEDSSVAPGNMESDVYSNVHRINLQVSEGSDKSKQQLNPFSRSPLMKELTRLGYSESLPDFLPKDSRRRRAMEKVCILFSQNLGKSILKQQKKIATRLGFSVASCCSDATHFVTDRFVRTRNMLEAIALGKPVVTRLWLETCDLAGYVIDEKSCILRDEKKEREIGFNMHVSLSRAKQHPLLKGRKVLITPNVKPSMDMVNVLVKAVGGEAVQSLLSVKTKNKAIRDGLLILSCEEDYTVCLPFLEKGAPIYNSELLLNGIITQKLEYERYQLFEDL